MDSNAIAQWAHDIPNTLGIVALYLEGLKRQADTVRRAHSDTLLKEETRMSSDMMREAGQNGMKMPRQTFDVTRTIEKVVGLVAPIVPAATTLHLVSSRPVYVTVNPKDMFRILFNMTPIRGGSDDPRRAPHIPNCASAIVPARKTPITRDITGGI